MPAALRPLLAALALAAAAPALAGTTAFFYDRGDDPFMQSLRKVMVREAAAAGIEFSAQSAGHDPMVQLVQLQEIAGDPEVDFILFNPCEPEVVEPALKIAAALKKPIVFFNRLWHAGLLKKYPQAWYVDIDAAEAGRLQADIVLAYEQAFPNFDRNGNGMLDCIILRGEETSEQALTRARGFIAAMRRAGAPFKVLLNETASWSQGEAREVVEQFIDRSGSGDIEAVISGNDAMAIGAAEALSRVGINNGQGSVQIPILGIDATIAALRAIADRRLTASISQPYKRIARTALRLGTLLAEGKPIDVNSIEGARLETPAHSVWLPQSVVAMKEARRLIRKIDAEDAADPNLQEDKAQD